MVLADTLYDWLEHAPSEAADHVLAAGLEHAEDEFRDRITTILLKRSNEASLGGLVAAIDRLPPDVQARVLTQTAKQPGGIAAAMRSSSVRARLNAMATLGSVPTPRLSYLLTYALRDGAGAVRDAAVRAGRMIAETFLDRPVPKADDGDGAALREYNVERSQLVQALREVARTYDRHFRLELLEVCLWFADDLETELWSLLESPRSNSGRAVQDHLQLWNGPRLAGFLLQCLKRSEWRRPAQQLLRGWQKLDAVTALLGHSAMLDDEDICRGLAGVNQPRWFNDCGADLGRLPAEVRAHAPRWLAAAGIVADQKVKSLSDWLRSANEELRRAAVYALAGIDAVPARRALRSCAGGKTSIGQFARWVLAGDPTGGQVPRLWHNGGLFPAPSGGAAHGDATRDPYAELWRVFRSTTGEAQAALLSILQEHADLAERPLRAALRAADPRERLLALRVVGTHRHGARFVSELEALQRDAVSAIRGLSQTVLSSVAQAGPAPVGESPAGPTAAGAESGAESAALEASIAALREADGASAPDRIRDVGEALRAQRERYAPAAPMGVESKS